MRRRPGTSDLNPSANDVIANLAIVRMRHDRRTDGQCDLYNAVGIINAILDIAGWFQ